MQNSFRGIAQKILKFPIILLLYNEYNLIKPDVCIIGAYFLITDEGNNWSVMPPGYFGEFFDILADDT